MHKYSIGGIAIGIMQVIDAGIIYSNGGACKGISLALSGVEFLWAIVSLVVLIRVKQPNTRLLALAFFLYNVFGWLLSIFTATPSIPVIIPMWFVVFGGIFGIVYAASSAYVAKKP
ncbi:MAG: hypothetical protein PHE55_17495 [Methylococcaceae bacterium]|nr:hypothetical protein [Methylococcaceae bacterium]